jgi:hypothetical protein
LQIQYNIEREVRSLQTRTLQARLAGAGFESLNMTIVCHSTMVLPDWLAQGASLRREGDQMLRPTNMPIPGAGLSTTV